MKLFKRGPSEKALLAAVQGTLTVDELQQLYAIVAKLKASGLALVVRVDGE